MDAPLGRSFDLYGGLGATAQDPGPVRGVEYAPLRAHGFLALEWRPWRRLSLVAETNAASRLVENIDRYPGVHWIVNVTGRLDLGARTRLDAGLHREHLEPAHARPTSPSTSASASGPEPAGGLQSPPMSPRPDAAVLALDQGTTGSTAFVFGPEGEVLGRAYAEITQHYPSPGWVEHDAEEIWQKTRRVAAEAVAASGIAPGALRADRHHQPARDDRPLGPQDRRPRLPGHRLAEPPDGRDLRAPEGRGPRAALPRAHRPRPRPLLLRQQDRLAPRGQPRAAGPRRGGRDRVRHDRLLAHPPPHRRPRARHRPHERVAHAPLRHPLPPLGPRAPADPRRARRHAARGAPELRRPSGRRWPSTGFPRACRSPGTRATSRPRSSARAASKPGMAKNTYGTGAFLVLNTGDRRVISRRGLLTTLCCDARGAAAYALEGSVFVAGAAVQWLRDEMGLVRTAAETGPIAESVPDTQGVYVVPAFTGLGAPYWDAGARGADPRPDPRGRPRPPRAGDAREPRLPEPRRHRRDERGVRRAAARAARRRRRLRQRLPDAVPGRRPRRAGGPSGPRRDDRGGCGVPGRPRASGSGRTRRRWRPDGGGTASSRPSMPPERREALYAGWKDAVARVRSL